MIPDINYVFIICLVKVIIEIEVCACGLIPGSNHQNVIESVLDSMLKEISSFVLQTNYMFKSLMVHFTVE